jgi:protease-4
MVRDRRHMDDEALQRVTDGRVFTGRQGLELKLIDAIGDEKTAVAWLEKEKGVKVDTPVKDWQLKPRLGDLTMLHLATRIVLEAVGLNGLAERIDALGPLQAVERLNLDGLLALWHPLASN